MKYVELGKTGLKCAEVSFGGIPIQRSDAANTIAVVDAMEQKRRKILEIALLIAIIVISVLVFLFR